ncbi:PhzF family phenazine biosynthesis protein [Paenibacillus sp. 1011MAR3C5]|uniref:PhzF family phenazine biosynthesis protein n=1 Tax=Paenibacillus sp. 1011MAR3C5 TaxID=1675787 RepID=UPI000E6C7EB6|nr:PhzF family phenazine biosynthesis protein [Paenibacillus sp. 1011MAR3C5]RJE90857.1 PhzF family phenazine biosynthesis protein [Paenibacillus sp. 1011MAR3C5]
MGLTLHIIDAFTAEAFRGNPAAVCVMEGPMPDLRMQEIAAEMNLSETAFVLQGNEGFTLRWFTPKAEVDLCGHATLAAAHALWDIGVITESETAVFHTKSGILTVDRDGEWVNMDFPAEPVESVNAPKELIEALGLIPRYVGRNRMDYLVEVDSEATVRSLQPDFQLLKSLQSRGVIVTSAAEQRGEGASYDFVSRAFFPGIGVNEDPVTGSAHCALAPYWGRRLRSDELTGYQASERGGYVRVQMRGDRVLLSGQAVTVLRGKLAE